MTQSNNNNNDKKKLPVVTYDDTKHPKPFLIPNEDKTKPPKIAIPIDPSFLNKEQTPEQKLMQTLHEIGEEFWFKYHQK